MKKVILILLAIIGYSFAAITSITIDETNNEWGTELQSPIFFDDLVIIPEGVTVTVEPGTVVNFENNLLVRGEFIAIGEPDNMIKLNGKYRHSYSIRGVDSAKIDIQHVHLDWFVLETYCDSVSLCNSLMTHAIIFFVDLGGYAKVVNNTFYSVVDNMTHIKHADLYNATIKNNILYGGETGLLGNNASGVDSITHNCFFNVKRPADSIIGFESESSNIVDVDPLFVDPSNNDFHLNTGSPAIDAGDPAYAYDNEPTDNGGIINLGMYGNTAEAKTSGASSISSNIYNSRHNQISLIHGELHFKYFKPYTVEIFSANGQLVKDISGSENVVSLNSLGLATGIYQMRVVQGADVFTGQFKLK